MKKRAVVMGASSGIGRALAKVLAHQGYEVGLAARRVNLLTELQKEIPTRTVIRKVDLRYPEEARHLFDHLIQELGGVDLVVLNSGVNPPDPHFEWAPQYETIQVNILGFVAMVDTVMPYFLRQESGHIVGISSIAGIRGSARAPLYNASKAFVSNYLEGLRQRLREFNIDVTDIRPGFVDTDMIRTIPGVFWCASPEKAANQIYDAIEAKKKVCYVTKRWGLLAPLFRALPEAVYDWGFRKVMRKDAGSGV